MESQAHWVDEEHSDLSYDERRVIDWRVEQSLALGLSRLEAMLVAHSAADLGLLRRLTGNGCPPTLAVKIAV